ncbi:MULTISPECIES: YrhB family protein [Micromonospora]|uniref:YrhB family protein n=1 Tax=Micromonospora TaxID=1873 RepID=UPI0021C8771B|nr:YrhB family protein [Micromonospora sp. Mcm103]
MITLDPARRIAEEFLDTEIRYRFSHPVVIVDYAVEERDDVYVFPYDGKAYVESGDWRQAMAGNAPVVVDRRTGEARFSD